MVSQFEVYLVNLDAEPSADARNTRPCVVISPDEMNRNVSTVIIAPVSARTNLYPTRIPITLLNSERVVVLDQLRAIDKARLVKKIGEIDGPAQKSVTDLLQELFSA